MSKRAKGAFNFFVRNYTNSNRKAHRKIYGEINREVKWNANIQPVSKKRTPDICKEIYSPALQKTFNSLRKKAVEQSAPQKRGVCTAVKTATPTKNLTQLFVKSPELVFPTESK